MSVSGESCEAGFYSYFDGQYQLHGLTANGAPIYQLHALHLFHDPSCDGTSGVPAWIITNVAPDPNRTVDLDGDNQCYFYAFTQWADSSAPPPAASWEVWCSVGWKSTLLHIEAVTSTTTASTTTSTYTATSTTITATSTSTTATDTSSTATATNTTTATSTTVTGTTTTTSTNGTAPNMSTTGTTPTTSTTNTVPTGTTTETTTTSTATTTASTSTSSSHTAAASIISTSTRTATAATTTTSTTAGIAVTTVTATGAPITTVTVAAGSATAAVVTDTASDAAGDAGPLTDNATTIAITNLTTTTAYTTVTSTSLATTSTSAGASMVSHAADQAHGSSSARTTAAATSATTAATTQQGGILVTSVAGWVTLQFSPDAMVNVSDPGLVEIVREAIAASISLPPDECIICSIVELYASAAPLASGPERLLQAARRLSLPAGVSLADVCRTSRRLAAAQRLGIEVSYAFLPSRVPVVEKGAMCAGIAHGFALFGVPIQNCSVADPVTYTVSVHTNPALSVAEARLQEATSGLAAWIGLGVGIAAGVPTICGLCYLCIKIHTWEGPKRLEEPVVPQREQEPDETAAPTVVTQDLLWELAAACQRVPGEAGSSLRRGTVRHAAKLPVRERPSIQVQVPPVSEPSSPGWARGGRSPATRTSGPSPRVALVVPSSSEQAEELVATDTSVWARQAINVVQGSTAELSVQQKGQQGTARSPSGPVAEVERRRREDELRRFEAEQRFLVEEHRRLEEECQFKEAQHLGGRARSNDAQGAREHERGEEGRAPDVASEGRQHLSGALSGGEVEALDVVDVVTIIDPTEGHAREGFFQL